MTAVLGFLVVLNVEGAAHRLLCSPTASDVTLARPSRRRWPPRRRKQTRLGRQSPRGFDPKPLQTHPGSSCPFQAPPWWPLRKNNCKTTSDTSPNCPACRANTHALTQLAVSDAHVALKQVIHLLNGLLFKCRGLGGKKRNVNEETQATKMGYNVLKTETDYLFKR